MLIPCGHRVLVKVPEVKDTSVGGIILVANEREKIMEKRGQHEGVIIAIGPSAWRHAAFGDKPWASIGDRVYFARYGGTVLIDPETDEEFTVLNDDDVTCIIKMKEGTQDE